LARRTSVIKIIDRTRSIFTDFLSVPKTIGKGPIITTPPPLAFYLSFTDEKSIKIIATKITMKPVRISRNPNVVKKTMSLIELHQFLQ
jgi:hypothetical protein